LRIAVHRAIPESNTLREQWNALVKRMERPEIFYTYEWALAMTHAYRASMQPLLLLAYDRESLLGVASLATDAAGRETCFSTSATADYCDFVYEPQCGPELLHAIFSELQALGTTTINLSNLPSDSITSRDLTRIAEVRGYFVFSRPAYQCARIMLGRQERRQEIKRAATKRKALRYSLKALSRVGPVRVEHLKGPDALQEALPRFIQAHIARFLAAGRSSNLARVERQVFITELTRLLCTQRTAVLSRLLVGDTEVAWSLGFQFSGSWFYYQPTFNLAFRQFSPGLCLLSRIVQDACDNAEIDLVDLGLGAEGYKQRFAIELRQTLHFTVTSSRACCYKAAMRYHAASIIKCSPLFESYVRHLIGRTSAELTTHA
jgi:CelD/BcsL family acetyltransferase involved in cellulose biosynthesis